jgi:hypothetical protein
MVRPSQCIRLVLHRGRGHVDRRRKRDLVGRVMRWMRRVGIAEEQVRSRPATVLRDLHDLAKESLAQLAADRLDRSRLSWLRQGVELELEARGLALEALAERIGAYDGRRISRVLPLLTRQEEGIRDAQVLVAAWPATDALLQRRPALLDLLEERPYAKLVESLRHRSGGRELAQVLRLLPQRLPATRDLMFVTAVVAQLLRTPRSRDVAANTDSAHCLLVCLQVMQPDGSVSLRLDRRGLAQNRELLQRLGLAVQPSGVVRLAYDAVRHHAMLDPAGAPMLVPPQRPEANDIRQLVLDNMQNEHILVGLLGNPRVVASAGLVETIVNRTRSIKVLLDIANRRELHSGSANRNVPLALLSHPSNIPVSALRKFVHVRYVDRVSLASMANRGTRVRPEVRSMATQYLKSIGNP